MHYIITLPGNPHLYQPGPLTEGWIIIGEIQRNSDGTRGALAYNPSTQLYAQANAGVMRNLNAYDVARALAATAGVDMDGEIELTAAQGADIIGYTVQAIKYWETKGYIVPVPGSSPKRYKKSALMAAQERPVKLGRPKKTNCSGE